MSLHRENIVWKSRDGTWSIGFYDYYYTGDTSDEDFDHEWDVEYDYSQFNWVSTGHPTEQAAHDSWDGCNPGSSQITSEPGPDTDRLDALAKAFKR